MADGEVQRLNKGIDRWIHETILLVSQGENVMFHVSEQFLLLSRYAGGIGSCCQSVVSNVPEY